MSLGATFANVRIKGPSANGLLAEFGMTFAMQGIAANGQRTSNALHEVPDLRPAAVGADPPVLLLALPGR
jgi:hypothetical protein